MINLKDINVKYVGRKASSSTATGNANKHLAQQRNIRKDTNRLNVKKLQFLP